MLEKMLVSLHVSRVALLLLNVNVPPDVLCQHILGRNIKIDLTKFPIHLYIKLERVTH